MPAEKEITVYPTYGYRTGDRWTVPMRIWVHRKRRLDVVPDDLIRVLLGDGQDPLPSGQEIVRCRQCIADFLADDDSGEAVSFTLAGDDQIHRFDADTDLNGLVEGSFQLPGDRSGRLEVTAEVKDGLGRVHAGTGRIQLLEPQGESVVSDIDDTIKVTEIPAGARIILRNTFLRDYVAAEGMRDRYVGLGDVSFHYVSGSPWQMFRLLHAFLIEAGGFPAGTFHMKSLRKNPLDLPGFLSDVQRFVAGAAYTKEQKIAQISTLMKNLPQRRFTLIGDSGELDPEVFSELRTMRPDQVKKIVIRDVVGAKKSAPQRLEQVDEVIDAPLVVHGVSQFA